MTEVEQVAPAKRRGAATQIAGVPLHDVFFPHGFAYLAVLVAIVVTIVWDRISPAQVLWGGNLERFQTAIMVHALALLILVRGKNRPQADRYRKLGLLLCATAFSGYSSAGFALLQTFLMINNHPWADATFAWYDKAIGFDWNAYFSTIAQSDLLRETLNVAYRKLGLVLLATLPLLMLLNRMDMARVFVLGNLFTAVIFTFIGRFFPVQGTSVFYDPDPALFTLYGGQPGTYHLPMLTQLRDSAAPQIDTSALVGMIAFPSYHTAAALLVVLAFYRTVLFVPALVFATLTILATPINGGHYLIDLLAGAVGTVVVVVAIDRFLMPEPGGYLRDLNSRRFSL